MSFWSQVQAAAVRTNAGIANSNTVGGQADQPAPPSTDPGGDAHDGSYAEQPPFLAGRDTRANAGRFQASGAVDTAKLSPPTRTEQVYDNGWELQWSPPVTDRNVATQRLFGKDSVPEGLHLERRGDSWLLSADETRKGAEAFSSIPTRSAFGHQRLTGSAAKPGEDAARLPEPTGPGLHVTKNVRSSEGRSYEVDFDRPMTQREAAEYFFGEKVPEKHEGRMWNERERGVGLAPVDGKQPTTRYKVFIPHGQRMEPNARLAIAKGSGPHVRRLPDWVGAKTRRAVDTRQLPPAAGSGLDVKQPKPGMHVWKEAGAWHSFNEKTGEFSAKPMSPTNEQYNRDIEQYVMSEGMSPVEAEGRFAKQWDGIHTQILGAFAMSLGALNRTDNGAEMLKMVRNPKWR